MGLRRSVFDDLIARFGPDAVKCLQDASYRILCDCSGCGFPTADKIALERLQVDRQSIDRQKAAVLHVLEENQRNGGHTWMQTDVLLTACHALIGFVPQLGYMQLLEAGEIVVSPDKKMTAKAATAQAEQEIATIIKDFLNHDTDI